MQDVGSLFAPAPFPPATDEQILVVVATFHVSEGVANTEPHTKIRRVIEAAGREAGLDMLRVEEEPTILKADEREAAKTLGQSYNAGIIIWGEDTGVEVIVNYLNLKEPDFVVADVMITEDERTQFESNAPVGAYKHFGPPLTPPTGRGIFCSFSLWERVGVRVNSHILYL